MLPSYTHPIFGTFRHGRGKIGVDDGPFDLQLGLEILDPRFGLDFSERLGREPGDEETESIGESVNDSQRPIVPIARY